MSIHISVVIPVYNSASTLLELYNRIKNSLDGSNYHANIIFVDDASEDDSWKIISKISKDEKNVSALQLLKNIGQGNATILGLKYAEGSYIVTLDDDLDHPPEQINNLISEIEMNPNIDALIGFHVFNKKHLIRSILSSLNNILNSVLFSKSVNLKMGSFRIIRKNIRDVLITYKHDNPAIGTLILSTTKRITNFQINCEKKTDNKSNYSISKMFELFLNNSLGLSNYALRYILFIGIFGSLISLFIGVWSIFQYILYGSSVPGWTSIIVILSFFSTFSFIAFGIIGEIVFKMYRSLMKSNNYIIRDKLKLD